MVHRPSFLCHFFHALYDFDGVSTCQSAGTENYEKFQTGIDRRKRTLVQYDYRHTDGELFSCVKPTLDECRAARDKWLTAKERKEEKR